MKKFKKILPFVLAAAMLTLLIAACNGAGATESEPPEPDESQNEYQPAVTLPAPIEPEDDPSEADNGENGEGVTILPLPIDPNEGEISPNLIIMDDTNLVYEEWPPVIVDGEGVQGSSHQIVGDEVFPNYVSLVRVAWALGSQVGIEGNQIVLDGFDGRISFEIGSTDFTVDNTTITLRNPALVIDDVLYVPVEFFREVFGASESFFAGGEVHITSEGGDMH